MLISLKQSNGTIKEAKGINGAVETTAYNPVTMSDRALVQKQKDVIKLQDEMLLDIESGVGRLHEKVNLAPVGIVSTLFNTRIN